VSGPHSVCSVELQWPLAMSGLTSELRSTHILRGKLREYGRS